MATLPTITIPDADVPRLRAALKARFDPFNTQSFTDAQLYKLLVIPVLKETVYSYEQRQAIQAAEAGVAPPPDMN